MNKNDDQKPVNETQPPENHPNHVSLNVAFFVASFVVCIAGAWYYVTSTSSSQLPGTPPAPTHEKTATSPARPRPNTPSGQTLRETATPVAPTPAVKIVTDADIGSEAPATPVAANAAPWQTPAVMPVSTTTPPNVSAIPDPLPPTPMATVTFTPKTAAESGRAVKGVDGRYAVQTNTGDNSPALSPTSAAGSLSPKKLAEKLATQQQQLIYNPTKTPTPTPSVESYGLTPTPSVKVPPMAVPEGLGKWSVTPTPAPADKDLRSLEAMHHLAPSEFIAPTPLPNFLEKAEPAARQNDPTLPPVPTPQAATAARTAATDTVKTDNLPLPSATPMTNNLNGQPDTAPSPTPSWTPKDKAPDILGGMPIPTLPAGSGKTAPQPDTKTDTKTDSFSDILPTSGTAGEKSKSTDNLHDILPTADAVPTVPPHLANKAQGTPRSGMVVSHGSVNTSATPPPSDVITQTPQPKLSPMPTPAATAQPNAATETKVPDLKELNVDPKVAKAAQKALAAKNGEAPPDDFVPDLTQLPPEMAKRIGAAAGLSVQVGERALSSESVKKQTDAVMEANGVDPKTDQRDNLELRLANDWAERTAVAEYARKQGETVSEAEIKLYLDKLDDKAKQMQQAFLKKGISRETLDEQAADAALVDKLVDERFRRDYGNDAALKQVYDKQPNNFVPSKSIRVSEIYKAMPADPKAAATVKDLMESLRNQASGGDFASIAMRESEAPSRAKGGELGWIDAGTGKISESMAAGLTDLKPGQVSKVVPGKDGYYIFKLEEVKDPKPGFEGARANVESVVREGIRLGYYEQAKAAMKVVVGGEPQLPSNVPQPKRNAKKAQPPAEGNSRRPAKNSK